MSTENNVSLLDGTRHLDNADLDHRGAFVDYVLEHADDWHREHLGHLYSLWEDWNTEHYQGVLWVPYLELLEPSAPNIYGCCSAISGFGGKLGIRIRPSLLTGTHPHMRRGTNNPGGRFRFVADVLLHEMIHQWQFEALRETEESYQGHGPQFRDKANEIGARLGLSPVRTNKARGKNKDRPSCSQWPWNVRDGGYYLGAYVPPSGDSGDRRSKPADLEAAISYLIRSYGADTFGEVSGRLLKEERQAEREADHE